MTFPRAFVVLSLNTALAFPQGNAMFRGDLAHTGVHQSVAPKQINDVLWRFKTGGRIFSSPVVADGVLYVGSNDHFLHAIDAAKGAEIWHFPTGANVTSTPAVTGGMVYFLSLDGNAYALDAHSGKLRWKFSTGAKPASARLGCTDSHRQGKSCPILGISSSLHLPFGMAWSFSAVAIATFTLWMRRLAAFAGNTVRAT